MGKKEKETRIMKVTLDKDEFDKLDRGEIHSNNGLRYDSGQLSALPDIAPVSKEELPRTEIIRTEVIYRDRDIVPEEPSFIENVIETGVQSIFDTLTSPEWLKFYSQVWHHKIKPWCLKAWFKITGKKRKRDATTSQTASVEVCECRESRDNPLTECDVSQQEYFEVSEEQAALLREQLQKKACEISSLIILLSKVRIKSEKTDEDRFLEQSYIKQLASDESTKTMNLLIEKRNLGIIDDETARSFSDFLGGYVRNNNQLIPIEIDATLM